MKFLQSDGTVIIFCKDANASADMTGIKTARKRKIVVDRASILKRGANRLVKLQEKLDMRKQLQEMRRHG